MNKLSKILLCIIIILVIALGISTFSYFKMRKSAKHNLDLYLESQEKITQIIENNKNEYSVDFNTVKKVTISHMSNNKVLSNVEKDNMLSKLSKINYEVVNEPGLIISTDYKIDFNNGIYFTFGNYGNEIDVYENNLKKFTTILPEEILDSVRNKFNMHDKNNLDDENLINKNQVKVD